MRGHESRRNRGSKARGAFAGGVGYQGSGHGVQSLLWPVVAEMGRKQNAPHIKRAGELPLRPFQYRFGYESEKISTTELASVAASAMATTIITAKRPLSTATPESR